VLLGVLMAGCEPPAQTAPASPRVPAPDIERVRVEVEREAVLEEFTDFRPTAHRVPWDVEVRVPTTGWRDASHATGVVRMERTVRECSFLGCSPDREPHPETFPAGTLLTTCKPDEPCSDEARFVLLDDLTLPSEPIEAPCQSYVFGATTCVRSQPAPVRAVDPGNVGEARWLYAPDPDPSKGRIPYVVWLEFDPGEDAGPAVTQTDLDAAVAAATSAAHQAIRRKLAAQMGRHVPDEEILYDLEVQWRTSASVGHASDSVTITASESTAVIHLDPTLIRDAVVERVRRNLTPREHRVHTDQIRWELLSREFPPGQKRIHWPAFRVWVPVTIVEWHVPREEP
jgi:hypothetical protein